MILAILVMGTPASSKRLTVVCFRSWNRHFTLARFLAPSHASLILAIGLVRSVVGAHRINGYEEVGQTGIKTEGS